MFEEDLCLQCGVKACLPQSIYCSGECAELDQAHSSPALSTSQSTASSAFPSPALPPVLVTSYNIPPLALDRVGSAMAKHRGGGDVWDDSDEDGHDHACALSYARRPSSTNHRSTIPLLAPASKPHMHRRGSSSLSSDVSASPPSAAGSSHQTTITARKRSNRASLPAHFSLLQATPRAARPGLAMLPPLAIPGRTSSRPSPSTPKLACPTLDGTPALAGASPSSAPLASVASSFDVTRGRAVSDGDRGRRREPGSTSRRREPSRSRSRSRRSPSRRGRVADGDERGRRGVESRDWVGAKEYGYGYGRTGLLAREAEAERGRAR